MKQLNVTLATALCGMLTLSSCSEEVMNPESDLTPASQLRIQTRGDANALDGRLYLFDGDGTCVQILSPDEDDEYISSTLSAGTYDIYAVAGPCLTPFSLPVQGNASPESKVTQAEGQAMGDLLMKQHQIRLDEGKTQYVDLQLERKVFKISSVSITSVPENVDQVTVAVSPVYQAVQLNGTYADPDGSCSVSLTDAGEGSWQSASETLCFPSKGKPVITITFRQNGEDKTFVYTGSESFTANHSVAIKGTYNATQGVTIRASLTSEAWGSSKEIDFDFNDYNTLPEAGKTYCGYYVVSADASTHKVVLLSKNNVNYTAPAERAGDNGTTDADWLNSFVTPMANLAKPYLATETDNWRLPTLEECKNFSKNTDYVMSYDENNKSPYYFFLESNILYWGMTKMVNNEPQFNYNTPYSKAVFLRPVIDITY
jgi:hypothetical protein